MYGTQRCFVAYTTSTTLFQRLYNVHNLRRRRINVKMTLCAYWVDAYNLNNLCKSC